MVCLFAEWRPPHGFGYGNAVILWWDGRTGDPLYKHWPFLLVRGAAAGRCYGVLYDSMAPATFDLGCEHSNYYGRRAPAVSAPCCACAVPYSHPMRAGQETREIGATPDLCLCLCLPCIRLHLPEEGCLHRFRTYEATDGDLDYYFISGPRIRCAPRVTGPSPEHTHG